MMVSLRLRREECQFILTWAQTAQNQAETVGVPFEQDELILIDKIRKAWEKKGGSDGDDDERILAKQAIIDDGEPWEYSTLLDMMALAREAGRKEEREKATKTIELANDIIKGDGIACADEELVEKIAKLEKEWKEADFWAWAWSETCDMQGKRIQQLEAENKKMREALEKAIAECKNEVK